MSEDVSAGRLALEVVADTSGLRADLKAKTDALAQQLKIQIQATVNVQADKAKADLKALAKAQTVKFTAQAETDTAKADLDKTAGDRTATIRAKADTTQAKIDLDALAKNRTTTVTAKVKTSGLDQLGDIGGKVSGALAPVAMAAGLVSAVGAAGQLAGALVAVGAAASEAAGLVGALPGLLLTGAQAAGSLVLGFSGIGKAVSAYSAAQSAAGTGAVQSAQQVQAAQDRVRTSAQALANAQIQGGEQVAQAQHGVQQAAQSLADAQYNAAQSVKSALHDEQQAVTAVSDAQYSASQSTAQSLYSEQQAVTSLADARYNATQTAVTGEHTYTDSLFSEKQAQVALTQAREDARQNLIQVGFDLRDAVLGEQQATLSLAEAKTKLQETLQSAATTSDQKTQAQLDYQQAQLQYDESIDKAKQATTAKQKADQAGVEGSQGVVTAKHAETDATFSVQQADEAVARSRVESAKSIQAAQHDLTAAVQAYSRSQVEAVRSVQEAEYQENQADQGYARSKVTANESVTSAQYAQQQAAQSLADTQRTTAQSLQNAQIDYTEAVKAARSPLLGVSTAQTALNKAMAGLTPQGRALVSLITSQVIPAYKAMQKSVAGALLPGVTSGLKSALPVIGTVSKGLTGTGKVLGGVASSFGSWLGSAGVNSDLSGVMATNTKAVGRFGDAALHVVDAIRNVTVVAEPLVTKISQWADKIARAADSLSKSGRESGSMAAFFDRAWKSATQLYDIGKNLLGTLLHIFGAAAPSGTSLLGSLVTATDKLDKWAGSSGGQASLKKFFTDTVPVAKQFGDLLVKAAGVIGKLVSDFGGGEFNSLFTVLNLALTILATLTKLPGFGQVVQWTLLLAGTGAGLGIVASKIAGIGKGLQTLTKLTGLDKITKALGLGDTVGGAIGGGVKKAGKAALGQKAVAAAPAQFAVGASGETERIEATEGSAATGLRGLAGKAGGWMSAIGQGAVSMAGSIKTGAAKGAAYLGGLASNAAGVASRFGSKMAGMGTAALQFVAGLGKQLVTGAKALVVFVAEHSVAAATFIGENVAMAVSATAAFVAENLATLGIVAGIALIVAAVIYLATHWSQVWGEVKKIAGDAWHWIDGNIVQPVEHAFGHGGVIGNAIGWVEAKWNEVWTNLQNWAKDGWNFIYNGIHKYLLVFLGPVGLIVAGILAVSKHWKQIWGDIKGAASDAWKFIKKGADGFVSGLKTTWNGLKKVFADPINFLINTVYTDGIRNFWDKVVEKVGLGKLDLPKINPIKLASGGRVPGSGPGDHIPILGEPGEWMLSKKQVAGFFGGGSLERGHAMLTALFGQGSAGPGYADGGGIGGFLSGVGHGISHLFSGAVDTAKAAAALATGNTTAFANAMKPLVSTSATGDLGTLMTTFPLALIKKAAAGIVSQFTGASGGGAAAGDVKAPPVTGTAAQWFAKAVQATGVPTSWIPALEIIGKFESSDNPLAQNNTDSNAAAGTPSKGLMQTIDSTFAAFHQKGTSNSIWDPIANIAAAINYIISRYKTVFQVPGIEAVAQGKPYVGYDTGGPLKPGVTSVLNATGRDEWVLTPKAVDLLGGPQKVAALNMASSVHAAGSTHAASAVAPARAPAESSPTVNVYPTPGMSEQNVADIAAQRLGFMLS